MICSPCHGLVEEVTFAQISCSCEVHRRCALGFFEYSTPQARTNGVRTGTYQVTCPALHEVHQEVDLHPLLQRIGGLAGPAGKGKERAIDASVAAAELRLNRRSTTTTETIELSRSAAERGKEDVRGYRCGTAPQQTQMKAPCGACGQQVTDRETSGEIAVARPLT